MHEYSIVQALLEQCEAHAAANHAAHVDKIVVKIGVMSGVEPSLLQTAFDTFKEGTVCGGGEFVMNIQPVTIRCRGCGYEGGLGERSYCCPRCESTDVAITDGEDMILMSLELS